MSGGIKIAGKLLLIFAFLCVTPFKEGIEKKVATSSSLMNNLVYQQKTLSKDVELKKQLNVMADTTFQSFNEDSNVESTSDSPLIVPKDPESEKPKDTATKEKESVKKNGKKIYIYDTHQDEKYNDGKTVLDGAFVLASLLEKKGYEVVVETNNFAKYRSDHNMTYDDAYLVSEKFMNDALVKYGGFDLCIDLHRDSVPREYTYTTINGKTYAKSMMVVAGSSKNVKSATKISTTLTDKVNKHANGIMKDVMTRKEAYYNQYVCKGVILMECGSENNSFEEVKNTLEVVAVGIDEMLKEGLNI